MGFVLRTSCKQRLFMACNIGPPLILLLCFCTIMHCIQKQLLLYDRSFGWQKNRVMRFFTNAFFCKILRTKSNRFFHQHEMNQAFLIDSPPTLDEKEEMGNNLESFKIWEIIFQTNDDSPRINMPKKIPHDHLKIQIYIPFPNFQSKVVTFDAFNAVS